MHTCWLDSSYNRIQLFYACFCKVKSIASRSPGRPDALLHEAEGDQLMIRPACVSSYSHQISSCNVCLNLTTFEQYLN